jgi:hypothetical protein
MKILVIEGNLMWSPRLAKSVAATGNEPTVVSAAPESLPPGYDVAIVNLGELGESAGSVTRDFQAMGTIVVAHAGHKEKDLHALGREAGCDILATNGELTWKLDKILEKAGNMLAERSVKNP